MKAWVKLLALSVLPNFWANQSFEQVAKATPSNDVLAPHFCNIIYCEPEYIKLILALYQVLSKYPQVRANHFYNLLDPALYYYSPYAITLKLVLPFSPLFGYICIILNASF